MLLIKRDKNTTQPPYVKIPSNKHPPSQGFQRRSMSYGGNKTQIEKINPSTSLGNRSTSGCRGLKIQEFSLVLASTDARSVGGLKQYGLIY